MISIKKASIKDIKALSIVAQKAFFEPHQKAIPKEIMEAYIDDSFNEENLIKEINNKEFEYHLIFKNDVLVGYSKIIINYKNENIKETNVTKMERLYLLKEFYGLGLGKQLFAYNLKLAKQQNQKGIWLYVWIKNYKAIHFYKNAGFKKIASYHFPISKTETRPNDVLYLEF
ncbi:GNAT family N-acetyltransferase [uncultured Polaribacter sp.]|uniref:GNAT family N-acetyltransferase n=1 Tax=uncultured Polaribacter sp. TaxID=174711 RepID=UPI002610AE97|nr:GNAT family N-acetyltransferase [uncultured Polaribacter sp.]